MIVIQCSKDEPTMCLESGINAEEGWGALKLYAITEVKKGLKVGDKVKEEDIKLSEPEVIIIFHKTESIDSWINQLKSVKKDMETVKSPKSNI